MHFDCILLSIVFIVANMFVIIVRIIFKWSR